MKKAIMLAGCLIMAGCTHKLSVNVPVPPSLAEAPSGFDSPPVTNGFETQQQMDEDRAQFEQLSTLPQLGPHFNNQGCVACHNNPETGGNSANAEERIGPDEPGDNVASATLIHSGSVPGFAQQMSPPDASVALRTSLNLMGDGFVEQIDDELLKLIASQNGGQWVLDPVLESPGTTKVGRFGWKDQEATLLSFAGDANFNEIGDCNRLLPMPLDPVNCFQGQIEDSETPPADAPFKVEDVDFYASFIRSLNAPPRGTTKNSLLGASVFARIGCGFCHIPTLYTKPYQTLAGKTVQYQFHPFGDFLLHDIGTGDGITQGLAGANVVRTAPLWGVSHKNRFFHDGRAYNFPDVIKAHRNEANFCRKNFNHLSKTDKNNLLSFLATL